MPLQFTQANRNAGSLNFTTNSGAVLSSIGLGEATQAEAEAGTILGRYMSPLRVAQEMAALGAAAIIPFSQPSAYPVNITYGHVIPWCDSDAQFGNSWSQYPLGSVSSQPLTLGRPGSSVGSAAGAGVKFRINFASTGLTGTPIPISYTSAGVESAATVCQGLADLVNADTVLSTVLNGVHTGQPFFMQPLGLGVFNLQYSAAFAAGGATPVTLTTTGSTGTVTLTAEQTTLDYPIGQFGHNVASRPSQVGDGVYALDFTCQDSTGTFNTHAAQIAIALSDPTAGAVRAKMIHYTAGGFEGYFDKGLALYDSLGVIAVNGTLGLGTINLPSTGKLSIAGINNIRRNAGSAQFIIETTTTDNLVLSSSGTGGIGLDATPTGGTTNSGRGIFVSGTQVPTTGAGISLAGGATPVLAARNYGTAAALPLAFSGTAFNPLTDDLAALGTTSLKWSDLHLASGGVINWNAGDVLITHSANLLAFTGATSGYTFDDDVIASIHTAASGTAQFTSAAQVGVNVLAANGAIGLNVAVPLTQFHVKIQTDQNSLWVNGATAGNPGNAGIGIWALQDDAATFVPMGHKASQFIFLTGGVSVGSTADPGDGKINAHTGFRVANAATSGNVLRGNGTNFVDAKLVPTDLGTNGQFYSFVATGVNFNSTNTDTTIPITLPTGFTRYLVGNVQISGASAALTTSTFGVFTAAAAGGFAVVASGSANTVSATADATNNNVQNATIINSNTQSYTVAGQPNIYFRVQTAQGSAATGTVSLWIRALP